jgi:CRP/FNR family cyclic AMP-dependent transcriptional regulator
MNFSQCMRRPSPTKIDIMIDVVDSTLDLRGVPTWEHHAQTCKAFEDLTEDQTLCVIYDYEPRPLRRRLQEQFADQFMWLQRRIGDGRWEVALRKVNGGAANPLLNFIDRCPAFAEASAETRQTLARIAVPRTVGRNQSITGQGMEWPFLGAVREGRIFAIAETPEGRDQILFEVLPCEVFGDVVLFDQGATIARFATFAEPAELLLFSRADVLTHAGNDPALAMGIAESCAQRARALIDLICAHVSKPTIARVASAIMPHAPTEFGLSPVDPNSSQMLRLGHIAATAGTVKEVVARALTQLEVAGAIKRSRGRIASIDRAKLANFI